MTKEYEPFDLEKALQGHPVVLRNGKKAYVRHYEKELETLFPLIGCIVNDRGKVENVCSWKDNEPNVKGAYPNLEDGTDIVGMFPQYKLVHGVKLPIFPDWSPALGETVLIVDVTHKQYFYEQEWSGDELDLMYQSRGLVYPPTAKGENAAEIHSKAMLGLVAGEQQDASN